MSAFTSRSSSSSDMPDLSMAAVAASVCSISWPVLRIAAISSWSLMSRYLGSDVLRAPIVAVPVWANSSRVNM